MRTVVSHTFVTLDGVATPDAVMDTIVALRNTKEVLDDFFGKVAEEDAMLLGRVTYQEWAAYWPTSDFAPRSRRRCRRAQAAARQEDRRARQPHARRSACCTRTCSTRCAWRSTR